MKFRLCATAGRSLKRSRSGPGKQPSYSVSHPAAALVSPVAQLCFVSSVLGSSSRANKGSLACFPRVYDVRDLRDSLLVSKIANTKGQIAAFPDMLPNLPSAGSTPSSMLPAPSDLWTTDGWRDGAARPTRCRRGRPSCEMVLKSSSSSTSASAWRPMSTPSRKSAMYMGSASAHTLPERG